MTFRGIWGCQFISAKVLGIVFCMGINHRNSVWKPKKKRKKLPMVEMLIFCTVMIYFNDLRFKKQNFPKICWDILWFKSKWPYLGHLSFLGEIRVMHFFPDHKFDYDCKAWRESPQKRRDALKMAILTKKSKIFIKAKLTVSKSCLLGHLGFMIFCILRGDLL